MTLAAEVRSAEAPTALLCGRRSNCVRREQAHGQRGCVAEVEEVGAEHAERLPRSTSHVDVARAVVRRSVLVDKRSIFICAAGIGALAFGGQAAWSERATLAPPVLAADLRTPMAQEVAEAARLGLHITRDGTSALIDNRWRHDFSVEAGECVAVIAGVTGTEEIRSLELQRRSGGVLASIPETPRTYVAQVQWCARERTQVRVELAVESAFFGGEEREPRQVLWKLASGTRGAGLDERTLTRNASADDTIRAALDQADDAAALARIAEPARASEAALVPDAVERSTPLDVDARSAVLLPPERATALAAQRALMTPSATAAIAPYFASVPAWLAAPSALPSLLGTESAALLRVADGWERVLAVVDFDALGPACVALTFARMAPAREGAEVVRVAIPSLARVPVNGRDGVSVDRACPASGLHLYTIPAAAAAPYQVRVHALPGSRPRARRRSPPWDGELLLTGERAQLERECAATNPAAPSACIGLARALLRDGAEQPDVDRAFEAACARGSADACGQLSTQLLVRAERHAMARAIALEQTACAGGAWVSCAARAARLASTAATQADLDEAHTLYQRACRERHLDGACRGEARMRELQLVAR